MMLFQSFLLCVVLATNSIVVLSAENDEGYGLDCSFPIHSKKFSCGDLLGDRKAVYEEYMQGCREQWGAKGAARCDANEKDRLEMSRRQARSMVVRADESANSNSLRGQGNRRLRQFFVAIVSLELHVNRIQEDQGAKAFMGSDQWVLAKK